jgi:Methyltransferase domain
VSTPGLDRHLVSFRQVWKGGFYAGDPLDRMRSPYGLFGFVGVPYAIVLSCIRPYVDENTVALEIGPGRGAYTRALLHAASVWCLDALPAEHNNFWEYVGDQPHVQYVEVTDFSCEMLPDDGIDYVFSYDTLCHVPFEGVEAYATSLRSKLRAGAHCFWMVADYAKYRRFIEERPSVAPALESQIGRPWLRHLISRVARHVEDRQLETYRRHIEAAEGPDGSWWYDAGTDRTIEMLTRLGYRVLEADVEADPRSPIIHFVRT